MYETIPAVYENKNFQYFNEQILGVAREMTQCQKAWSITELLIITEI